MTWVMVMKISKHDWYQNNTHIIINIFITCDDLKKHFSLDDINVFLNDNKFLFSFKKEIVDIFECELFGKAEIFNVSIQKKIIEIKLKKKEDVFWKTLEKKENADFFNISYPSSAKEKKDWKISKNEFEENGVPIGEDPTTFFFQNIYKTGTDEQRKAIMKSMQESNGKVLSNNWNEVKGKKVEYKEEK